MDDHVRKAKEEFVSNLNGTTWLEIDAIQLMQPMCVLLLCTFVCFTQQQRGEKQHHSGTIMYFLTDFLFTITPLLLLLTVFADFMPAVFESSAVFIILLLAVICKNYKHVPVSKLLSLDVSLDYISWYRGYVNILTAICILAVDFRCYPRRLAKTETFGTGLMDIFVGAFIMCNSIVCKEATNLNANRRTLREKYDGIVRTLRSSLPLTILGVARLVTTKASNYQEHTSEYGVHWNFFLTLAATRVGCTVLLCLIRPSLSLVMSISLAGIYQYLLSHGLQDYILRPGGRDEGFISANREGIFSTIGYMSLYCAGVTVGQLLFRTRQKLGNKVLLLIALCAISAGTLMAQIYTESTDIRISRRLANLPFILWTIHHSVLVLAMMLLVSILLNVISACFSVQSLSRSGSEILEAVNYNGLLYFIVANLLTGAVNISINTLGQTAGYSLSILLMYLFVLNGFTYVLYKAKIKTKFW